MAVAVKNSKGCEWYLDWKLHRDDGPAVVRGGYRVWYNNGQRHRVDGPATIYSNGDNIWYFEGKLHRTDGPAVEYTDGRKLWYYNGINTTNLIEKMSRIINRRKWRSLISTSARKWALKTAIEWRPPMGVQYRGMMNDYEY